MMVAGVVVGGGWWEFYVGFVLRFEVEKRDERMGNVGFGYG